MPSISDAFTVNYYNTYAEHHFDSTVNAICPSAMNDL